MASTRQHQTVTVVRWTARVLALIFTLVFFFWDTVYAVGSIMTDLHGAITTDIIIPIALGILVLAAYFLSWWRERLGGMLFILVSVTFGVIHLISGLSGLHIRSITNMLSGWLIDWAILGLPMLIVGILFLITSWLSKRNVISPASKSGGTINQQSIHCG